MNNEWSKTTRYMVGVGLGLLGLYILYLSRSMLGLLIMGAIIAFLVRPVINIFHVRLKVPRGLSIFIAYLIATILILVAPLIFVPPIVNAVSFLLSLDYQALFDRGLQWLIQSLTYLQTVNLRLLGFNLNLNTIVQPILTTLQNSESGLSFNLPTLDVLINSLGSIFATSYGVAVGVIGSVFSAVLSFSFMILAAIYFNVDGHRLYDWFLRTIPPVYQPELITLLNRLKTVWEQFFVGQFILILSMGLMVWVGGAALGLPDAFPLAVIAALFEIVPAVGAILAAIPAVIVALLQGSTYLPVNTFVFALIVIGFYLLVHTIINNLIYPLLLGEVIDLHPMIIFTGVIVGATQAGLLGALLAPAVIASAREIIRYLYRKMWGEDPFPPNEAPLRASFSWAELQRTLGKLRGLWRRPVAPPPPEAP